MTLRRAEVDFALQQIDHLSWIDKRNLFLAGHSEGGLTTAMYGASDFNAYFISGWTCASTNPEFDRIHARRDLPVLAVLGDQDEYYPRTNGAIHCGNRMGGRNASRSVVIPGARPRGRRH